MTEDRFTGCAYCDGAHSETDCPSQISMETKCWRCGLPFIQGSECYDGLLCAVSEESTPKEKIEELPGEPAGDGMTSMTADRAKINEIIRHINKEV